MESVHAPKVALPLLVEGFSMTYAAYFQTALDVHLLLENAPLAPLRHSPDPNDFLSTLREAMSYSVMV